MPFLADNSILFYELEDYIALTLFLSLHLFVYFKIRNLSNRWLVKLWWYCSIFLAFWSYLTFNHIFFDDQFERTLVVSLWTIVSIFTYWLIYTGLFQFNLANNRQVLKTKLNESLSDGNAETDKPKISRSYFDKLLGLMENQALYRNPDLGRKTLADELGISEGYLTQLIKENTGTSFTAFINKYRVKDVERMLQDESFENFDILSIGLEAGFMSKSAFFANFKKINGITPSQFRKKVS